MSNQTPMRLALIGGGNQGQEHLKAISLSQEIELVAIVDSDVRMLEQVKSRYAHLNLFLHDQISELHQYQLDGLILGLGIPLLKEKPLGRTLDEARSLLAQARALGCPLQTAIQRRYHPTYQALKRKLTEQKAVVKEAHVHLHLGLIHKAKMIAGVADKIWRGEVYYSTRDITWLIYCTIWLVLLIW